MNCLIFLCPDDVQQVEYLNLFDNLFNCQINIEEQSDGNLSESDDSSNEVLQDAVTTLQPDESETKATRSCVTLSNLCNDPNFNKDALFLVFMAKVTEMDTSEIFLFLKLGFTPRQAEQPLQGMELQEEAQKV